MQPSIANPAFSMQGAAQQMFPQASMGQLPGAGPLAAGQNLTPGGAHEAFSLGMRQEIGGASGVSGATS